VGDVAVSEDLGGRRRGTLRASMTALRRQLLWVARLEGVSYLLLVGVAMPLKYLAGVPIAVRISGAVHGVLFLAFVVALWRVTASERWPLRRAARWFVASLVPLALFVVERELRPPR
jgi:integral membrane protein